VSIRVSFTPSGQVGDTWTMRVLAGPEGLLFRPDPHGESTELVRPDFEELDRRMLKRRTGYQRRLLPTGVIEITATSEHAKTVLSDWLLDMDAG
jgi:hypothetical protein